MSTGWQIFVTTNWTNMSRSVRKYILPEISTKPAECLQDAVWLCVALIAWLTQISVENHKLFVVDIQHFSLCQLLRATKITIEFGIHSNIALLRRNWMMTRLQLVCLLCRSLILRLEKVENIFKQKWNKRRMDGNEPHVNTFVLSSLKSSPTQIAWPVRLYSVSTCLLPSNAYTRNSHTTQLYKRGACNRMCQCLCVRVFVSE